MKLYDGVAPVRERGLKSGRTAPEIPKNLVAPVRERGLKCNVNWVSRYVNGRSREGAWIEIREIGQILQG